MSTVVYKYDNASPNHSGHRNQPITKIAHHHTAGAIAQLTPVRFLDRHQDRSCTMV